MTEMSAAEAAVVARFEAGEPAPESWGGGLRLVAEEAVVGMAYDWYCPRDPNCPRVNCRWCVAEVVADALANKLAALRAKAAAADRVRELHVRDDGGWCTHCGDLGEGDGRGLWPCPSITALDGPPC